MVESVVDQLVGDRADQQARPQRHHHRDDLPAGCQQVGDQRADQQARIASSAPQPNASAMLAGCRWDGCAVVTRTG